MSLPDINLKDLIDAGVHFGKLILKCQNIFIALEKCTTYYPDAN